MKYLFWIDLEMTGLNVLKDEILELGIIVTDLQMNEKETFHEYISQPEQTLLQMDDWCKTHHTQSGLWEKVLTQSKPLIEVEQRLLQLCSSFYDPDCKIVLAGNSIWQDRKFIEKYLPNFTQLLHYRMLHISSYKLLFENLYQQKFKKLEKHRSLDDIRESMEELRFYQTFFTCHPKV